MTIRVEDIGNRALSIIGHPHIIADIYEGSPASAVVLQHYGQTLEETLGQRYWDFARKTITLTLIKAASNVPPVSTYPFQPPYPNGWTDTFPPPPWAYEYAYPADCITFRQVAPLPGITGGDLAPTYNRFSLAYDAPTVGGTQVLCILTNLPSAMGIYTARVTDPAQWESPSFIDMLVVNLVRKLTVLLGDKALLQAQQQPPQQRSAA